MTLLSERNHVVWVNYHGSRRPRLTRADAGSVAGKLRQFITGPQRVRENLTVLTPLVVPVPGSAVVERLNRRLIPAQIRRLLQALPARPVQVWSFAPDVDYLCGRFGEEALVYYCVDAFSAFSGYDREAVLAAERRLAARADLVVATSRVLYEAKRPLNSNTMLVPHGVDADHFARARGEAPIPEDVASLRGPVLGFWGLLQDWLDVELLAAVARARADWSLVLIGEAATDVSSLRKLSNVHLLGRRSYASLPGYARRFDVGLIPFRVNELTRAVNPIKLREYLAAGLPVVSTPLPEVEGYRAWVRVADGAGAFVAACERAMAASDAASAARRMAAMRRETWPEKVAEVSERLQGCLDAKGRQRASRTEAPVLARVHTACRGEASRRV
ncbi:MAG: glycosyltransferase [Phycisphaerae bacterium]